MLIAYDMYMSNCLFSSVWHAASFSTCNKHDTQLLDNVLHNRQCNVHRTVLITDGLF